MKLKASRERTQRAQRDRPASRQHLGARWQSIAPTPLSERTNGPGSTSDATAINDAGYIGGWSKGLNATTSKATLWRGASVNVLAEDLNDPHLVKLGTGWSLEAVTAINNNRVIVGNGKLNGKTRGFVMVPMPASN